MVTFESVNQLKRNKFAAMAKTKPLIRRKPAIKKVVKPAFIKKHLFSLALVLVLIFITWLRLRLLNVPLERDEGEYAYFGSLLLKGIPPYKMAYSMKFPGTYFVYAVFMFFLGQNTIAVHLGLLIANLISAVFLFLLVRTLINDFAGLVAAAVFGVLALNDGMLGFAAHATHFVVMAAIPGLYYMLCGFKTRKPKYFFIAGVLLGLAPLFKQSGIFFSILGFLSCLVFWAGGEKQPLRKLFRNVGLIVAGGLLPIVVVVLYLISTGVWENFWFWTIKYPFAYGSQVTFDKGMGYLLDHFGGIIKGFGLLWVLIVAGLPLMFFTGFRLSRKKAIIFLLAFFIFSVLTIVPGFYFRHHYFVSLMPVMAVFAGVSANFVASIKLGPFHGVINKIVAILIMMLALGIGLSENSAYYFIEKPADISRRIYGSNPFVESEAIGDFIRRKTKPGDKVAVLGSEPQIYFFAQRQSATGFIYMYPMMEMHDFNLAMQEQMIQEVEAADPEILVFVDISASWLKKPKSPTRLLSWAMQKSAGEAYQLIGTVEIFSDATLYKFSEVALKNQPESNYRVRIFRKSR